MTDREKLMQYLEAIRGLLRRDEVSESDRATDVAYAKRVAEEIEAAVYTTKQEELLADARNDSCQWEIFLDEESRAAAAAAARIMELDKLPIEKQKDYVRQWPEIGWDALILARKFQALHTEVLFRRALEEVVPDYIIDEILDAMRMSVPPLVVVQGKKP